MYPFTSCKLTVPIGVLSATTSTNEEAVLLVPQRSGLERLAVDRLG